MFKKLFSSRTAELQKLGFDVVHGCQLRCVGCPNSLLTPKISFISPADFSTCLSNIDVKRVRLFRLFNFGESFLHRDLVDLVLRIPSPRWSIKCVEISTNGQVHDFERVKEVLKTGVLNRLAVSCDGNGSAEDYERLRPPAKWPKLLEFLTKVRELRDAHAPQVELITRTICEKNEEREKWERLLKPLGWTPDFREWMDLPETVRSQGKSAPTADNRLCSFMAQSDSLYVDADGTVVPCCVNPRASVLGNLKEAKYSDIIRSKAYTAFVQSLKANRSRHPICGSCTF